MRLGTCVRHIRMNFEVFQAVYVDCAPLASKSGISDVFSGVLEPFILPCVCADALHAWAALEPSASSVHDFLLPPGRSGRLGSAGCMLIISCIFPAVFAWFSLLYVCVHMFGVPAWLRGLDLVISTDKFYVFVIFRCVLMGSVVSVVVSKSLQMSSTSLCPSTHLTGFQALRCCYVVFAPPTSNLASVPSLSPIAAVSQVSSIVEASIW